MVRKTVRTQAREGTEGTLRVFIDTISIISLPLLSGIEGT